MEFKVGDYVRYTKHVRDYDPKYFSVGKMYKVVDIENLPYVLVVENDIIDDTGLEDQVYVSQISKYPPNNALSRLVYPDHVPTYCGKFLVPRSSDEI